MQTRTVGFYIFDGVVLLEFAGPLQVFDVANRVAVKSGHTSHAPFRPILVAKTASVVYTREGVGIAPHATVAHHEPLDLVIVPGGALQDELADRALRDWLQRVAATAEVTGSVCVGSFMLAKAGLLDGREVTTHFDDAADLCAMVPRARVISDRLWVDEGKVVT